jgi:hypothetical protein
MSFAVGSHSSSVPGILFVLPFSVRANQPPRPCRAVGVLLLSLAFAVTACGHSPDAPDAPTAPTPAPGGASVTAHLTVSVDTLGSSIAIPGLSQLDDGRTFDFFYYEPF